MSTWMTFCEGRVAFKGISMFYRKSAQVPCGGDDFAVSDKNLREAAKIELNEAQDMSCFTVLHSTDTPTHPL